MNIEAFAADLLRGVVKHGRLWSLSEFDPDEVVSADSLEISRAVAFNDGDSWSSPSVADNAMITANVTDRNGNTSRYMWAVSLEEAITRLASEITVTL